MYYYETCILDIPTVEWINGLLAGSVPCDTKDAETIVTITGKFQNGYEYDLKLVSGGRAGEDDADLPYLDPVIFDPQGRERGVLEPDSENVLGEYRWNVGDDTYILTVEQKED